MDRSAREVLASLETSAVPEYVQKYYARQKSKQNTEGAKVVLETLRTDLIPMQIQFSQYDQYERLQELRQKAIEIEKIRQIQRKRAWGPLASGIAAISLGMTTLAAPAYAEEIKIDPILQVKPEVVNEVNQDQGTESEIKTVIDNSHNDSQQILSKSEPKTEIVVDEKEQLKESKPEPKSDSAATKQGTTKSKSESVVKAEPVTTNQVATKQDSSKPEPKITLASSSTKVATDHTKIATFTKTADQSVIAQLNKLSTDPDTKTQTAEDTTSIQKAELYQVQKGDTLWKLAEKYYGNGNLWVKIWDTNKEKLIQQDPRNADDLGHWIYPGQELQIPTR